jgi:transposase-like protein
MKEVVEIGRATQDELRGELSELFRGAIRLTLEMVLEEELKAMVGARRFERVGSRKDHRNGTYLRRLLTSLGQIDMAMPRSRGQGSPADVIGRYQRRSPELDEMMVEAYVSGVSQRKMADVTEALMGERVGRSTVVRSHSTRRVSSSSAEARASTRPNGSATNDCPKNRMSPSRPTRLTAATNTPLAIAWAR